MTVATRPEATRSEVVPWADFLAAWKWQQGEHVSLIGPTGRGKTTLALAILPRRTYRVVVATKPADPVLQALMRAQHYRRINAWPPPALSTKVLLWPPFSHRRDLVTQRQVIDDALMAVFQSGGWCIYVDELYYLSRMLRLDTDLRLIWQQGRGLKISLVGGTQRPAWVPLEMYTEATHLFFWGTKGKEDLARIGGLGLDADAVKHRIRRLGFHECLYVNTRTGEMMATRAEKGT